MSNSWVKVINSETDALPPVPLTYALKTPYEFDRFQKFAIDAIELGENVLCCCKTGAGKTTVAEYQIAKSLQRGGRIFYTTPIKSLSNQKFNDLKKLFPEASVGIMTGDIKFRPDAQILVMTTEILRNLLFKKGSVTEKVGLTSMVSMDSLDAVVFDEVHYINDPDRGHIWEETIMLLPATVKLVLLSATLSQPYGFAKWLGTSKKVPVSLISTQWRAVPLHHYILSSAGELQEIYTPREQLLAEVYSAWLRARSDGLLAHDKFQQKVKDARRGGQEGPIAGKTRPKAFEHQLNELMDDLNRKQNLPAIFFVFSRAGCEKLAGKVQSDFLDSSETALVAQIWDFHLSRYSDSLEKSPQAHALRSLAMRGIAYHHSGLLPFMKEILEILFSKGLIKLLFATETFAVGINMPTKTVVFTALEKFSGGSMRSLRSAEYIQMAGRAGRRGKDDRGLVIYLPQRDPVDLPTLRGIMCGKTGSFESRMCFHYDFLLKMILSGLTLSELVRGSYWWALLEAEVERSRLDYHRALSESEAAFSGLTADQIEACDSRLAIENRIQTGQNSKKKTAMRELAVWEQEHFEKSWPSILARHGVAKELLSKSLSAKEDYEAVSSQLADSSLDLALPQIKLRSKILQEYGYLTGEGLSLTPKGHLASEINEGHPFLMVELFGRLRKDQSLPLGDLLTILAIFLGESKENSLPIDQLQITPEIRHELLRIQKDAEEGIKKEKAIGLPSDLEFWELSTEWVEAVAHWISSADYSLSELAMKFGIFEGNCQKALMKLMGLVEEFRAMCELSQETGWLTKLEDAQSLVLHGIVMAESLYLRI